MSSNVTSAPMQDLAAIAKALRERGYIILKNAGKRPLAFNWNVPSDKPAPIRKWNAPSIGVAICDGLGVIDIDVNHDMANDVVSAISTIAPEVAAKSPARYGGGEHKVALFVRIEGEPFVRIASHRFALPGDPDKKGQLVEVFGGQRKSNGVYSRQFGAYGAHSLAEDGSIVRSYEWAEGLALHEVDVAQLPALTRAQASEICAAFEQLAQGAKWEQLKTELDDHSGGMVFDITGETRFDLLSGTQVSYDELGDGDRCSSTFWDGLPHNTKDKCSVWWSNRFQCYGVKDFETGITHYPAELAPPDTAAGLPLLRQVAAAQGVVIPPPAPNWPGGTYINTNWPKPCMANALTAMKALGIIIRHDVFHDERIISLTEAWQGEPPDFLGPVNDARQLKMRALMHARFGTDFRKVHTQEAADLLAAQNQFNPVLDMLEAAQAAWDGVKRLDRVAADYFNCEDTALNARCMRKVLIGAVARARKPGVKFDTVVILESPEGYGKSSAWSILAGEENFSDENILGLKAREVQEHLQGVWIHESAELAGMSKAETDHVKAQLSRKRDKARAAYAHYAESVPRSSVWVGTTNEEIYLQSPYGNRRFWPMQVHSPINLARLRADRLQLWGEAARAQAAGEALELEETLWAAAGDEQEKRRLIDPWETKLSRLRIAQGPYAGVDHEEFCIHVRDGMEIVTTSALLDYLLGKGWTRSEPWVPRKLAAVMKALKWAPYRWRDETNSGQPVRGYKRPLTVPANGKVVPFSGTRKDK